MMPGDVGSWVLVHRETKHPVAEVFTAAILARIDYSRYEAIPSDQYLSELKARIKQEKQS